MALAEKLGVPYILDLTITPMMDGSGGPLAHRASVSSLLPVMRDPVLQSCKPQPTPESIRALEKLPASLGSAVSSGIESLAYEDLPCSAGHNSCYISPYGDVYPCVQLPQAAGNLRRDKFTDIWYHAPELERLRAVRESQLPVCSQCDIRNYCERCPGLALMEGGDLLSAYERACELAEVKASLAGVINPISKLHHDRAAAPSQTTPEFEFASLAVDSSSD
jgi:radical SAM protein with 4Fe4S-binding SPASM domain